MGQIWAIFDQKINFYKINFLTFRRGKHLGQNPQKIVRPNALATNGSTIAFTA